MPGGTSGPGGAIEVARFSLTIDGVEIAQFSELGGITSEVGPDDLAEKVLRKLPGRRTPPTVTLRRALTKDLQLAAWQDTAVERQTRDARKNATLTMYTTDGTSVARYYLENAWPSKIEISALKAGASEVLYETVTLTCDVARRVAR